MKVLGLQQCIGVWEINPDTVKNAGNKLERLAVCKPHFHLDQTRKYHPTGIKQDKSNNFLRKE